MTQTVRTLVAVYFLVVAYGMGGGPIRAASLPKLINLVQDCPSAAAQIIQGIEQIATENEGVKRGTKSVLQRGGTWQLLWTTEKEINFFFDWPFSKADKVTQTLLSDGSGGGVIENLIEYRDGGIFSVTGSVADVAGAPSRTAFSFESASVRLGQSGPKFTLPPIGKGSFKTLYMNDKYRLSKDETRGDYTIFEWLG